MTRRKRGKRSIFQQVVDKVRENIIMTIGAGLLGLVVTVAVVAGQAYFGVPPYANAQKLAEVDKLTNNALLFQQQSVISNAQDWYEKYTRDVLSLMDTIRRNPGNLSAKKDLDFAVSRRDFYKRQLDLSQQSNEELLKLIAPKK